MASAPAPGNCLPLSGRSTLTDFSMSGGSATPGSGARTAAIESTVSSSLRDMSRSSSGCDDWCRFHRVAHEPGWVPVRPVGLRNTVTVDGTHHQRVLAGGRQGEMALPPAEAVLARVVAELGRQPCLAAVGRELHARDAGVAAEGNAPRQGRHAGMHAIAGLDVGDEG